MKDDRSPRVAVLDTNLLLLSLVGVTDPALLATFKRVKLFTIEDLEALTALVGGYRSMMTTPHVLAEVCNFIDQAPQYRRRDLMASVRRYAQQHLEQYDASSALVERRGLSQIGLSDTGLESLSHKAVVITMDEMLARQIGIEGGFVINFNHARGRRLLEMGEYA